MQCPRWILITYTRVGLDAVCLLFTLGLGHFSLLAHALLAKAGLFPTATPTASHGEPVLR